MFCRKNFNKQLSPKQLWVTKANISCCWWVNNASHIKLLLRLKNFWRIFFLSMLGFKLGLQPTEIYKY